MTLIYKIDLDILKTYMQTKKTNFLSQGFQKTDRQATDRCD